jgi:hypothetical protein
MSATPGLTKKQRELVAELRHLTSILGLDFDKIVTEADPEAIVLGLVHNRPNQWRPDPGVLRAQPGKMAGDRLVHCIRWLGTGGTSNQQI